VPGAASPFIDAWAPAQYVYGSSGGPGPIRSPDPNAAQGLTMNNTQATYDGTLHLKLAGTVLLALVGVFVLQAMGFRFVVAVGG
jgi:hypothetical protein